MKYKPPRVAAIFFWPIYTGQGGGAMAPLAPPDPLLLTKLVKELAKIDAIKACSHQLNIERIL